MVKTMVSALVTELMRSGTLPVHVLGSSLPMKLCRWLPMTIIFSILRSLLLTFLLLSSLLLPGPAGFANPLSPLERFDVFVVDQQSVCVPLLRLVSGSRVVFYCHFPDKFLSQGWSIDDQGKSIKSHVGLLRTIYRWPIDKLEESTTGELIRIVEMYYTADGKGNPTSSSPTLNSPRMYIGTPFHLWRRGIQRWSILVSTQLDTLLRRISRAKVDQTRVLMSFIRKSPSPMLKSVVY